MFDGWPKIRMLSLLFQLQSFKNLRLATVLTAICPEILQFFIHTVGNRTQSCKRHRRISLCEIFLNGTVKKLLEAKYSQSIETHAQTIRKFTFRNTESFREKEFERP